MILHEAELVYEIVSVQVNYDASYTSKDHLPLVLVILPVLLISYKLLLNLAFVDIGILCYTVGVDVFQGH